MDSQQPIGDDVHATTVGMKINAENEIAENHVNNWEASDDLKNWELGGDGSDAIPGGLQEIDSQWPMGDDVNATTEGITTLQENDTSETHVNSGEVSDDPKTREVSGGGSEDAIPGGLQDIDSQQQMGDDVNATTEGMTTLSENEPSETHVESRKS